MLLNLMGRPQEQWLVNANWFADKRQQQHSGKERDDPSLIAKPAALCGIAGWHCALA
jgi:hypothetical protein